MSGVAPGTSARNGIPSGAVPASVGCGGTPCSAAMCARMPFSCAT